MAAVWVGLLHSGDVVYMHHKARHGWAFVSCSCHRLRVFGDVCALRQLSVCQGLRSCLALSRADHLTVEAAETPQKRLCVSERTCGSYTGVLMGTIEASRLAFWLTKFMQARQRMQCMANIALGSHNIVWPSKQAHRYTTQI